MNEDNNRVKKVVIKIIRADNLVDINDKKMKKQMKWRVEIICNKKKYFTDLVTCVAGQPYWNNDIEIKLVKDQIEPIVMVIVDASHNHYGQVIIPISKIPLKSLLNGEKNQETTLQCSELEPVKKCSNPIGNLFYKIFSVELYSDEPQISRSNYTKRLSFFGSKSEQKPNRKQSCLEIGSPIEINHYDLEKIPKRLSIFKINEKSTKLNHMRSKAKSLANIHTLEDVDQSMSSDSDFENQHYMPPDEVYNQVTRNLGWVRVEDVVNDNNNKLNFDSYSSHEIEHEKVDLLSVQPDNGPITGNFTVVMEGSNFTSGLFDLTYVCIDGLEPIDATTCTKIVSDTELLLLMPAISTPGHVNIHLELLDGSRISCSKTFHYIDSLVDSLQCNVLTPRGFDNEIENSTVVDKLFNQFDELPQPTMNGCGPLQNETGIAENGVNVIENFNKYDRRKLSDYGSQGSFRSDRTSSIRKKIKKPNLSKTELHEEVECLRKEVGDLKSQIQKIESTTSIQLFTLKCQLESRENEIDEISRSLCNLKMQLLEDGMTKYLELI